MDVFYWAEKCFAKYKKIALHQILTGAGDTQKNPMLTK